MRNLSISALAAGATLLLAACGSNTEERAATGISKGVEHREQQGDGGEDQEPETLF